MTASAQGTFGADGAAQAVAMKQGDLENALTDSLIVQQGSYADFVAGNLAGASDLLFTLALFGFETLPLMLIGMALYRMKLFDGGIPIRRLTAWGWGALAIGGALSLWIALETRAGGFTYFGTLAAFLGWSHFPRLLMVLGLAALLAAWGARAQGRFVDRLSAAGRAAFTNYIGTSFLMMLVFHGWAGGLHGELTRGGLYLVVLFAWAVMLAWSKPWLDRFRYGPLEWLWRCLTYGRLFPLRR